jgi:uncharacterized phage protein (TIGR02220 family)
MNIIKRHKRDTPFVMISREALSDENLSLKSKGLLAYLLSLPDDWKIYVSELEKHSRDGRDSTRSALNELIDNNYIIREKVREKGKFKGYNYTVFDFPQQEIQSQPKTEKPKTEKPKTEKPQLLNKYNTNKDNTKNKKANKKDFLESYKELVEYFQKVTGKKMRLQPTDGLIKRSNKYKLVANRLIEGATLEDLKRVIDLKTKEWKGDKKMVQYLRFETLFNRSKFESYLDEVGNLAPQGDYTPPYEIPDFKTEDERYRFFLFRFTKYKPHLNQTLVNTKYRQRAIIEKDAEGLCYDLEREFPELLKINISFKGNN